MIFKADAAFFQQKTDILKIFDKYLLLRSLIIVIFEIIIFFNKIFEKQKYT
jgi:hypothetical protein